MSANTFAIDAMTRHQIHIQRLSGGMVNRIIPFLDSMSDDISNRIAAGNLTQFQSQRLSLIQRDIDLIVSSSMSTMGTQLNLELNEFGNYETGFTQRLLDRMITLSATSVGVNRIAALISDTPMSLVSGKKVVNLTIDQAINQFAGTAARDVTHVIQTGIAEGKTTSEISRQATRLVKNRTRAQTEALIRTAANHTGTLARGQTYAENADIIDREKFVATLDSRTSLTCSANDGKHFQIGEGPMPALHFNCRSVRIPIVHPDFVIGDLKGERPSIGSDGAKVVSGQSTYGGWLRKQPVSFQNEALGPERAKLFRNGGLSIDKFTNDRDITYTLDELRGLEPQAFERANL